MPVAERRHVQAVRGWSRSWRQCCTQAEWRRQLTHDGQSFTTPGACARYVALGGTLRSNPYPQGKQACDRLRRGTFTVADTRFYTAWTCEWRAAAIGTAVYDSLWSACRSEGGEWTGEHPASTAGRVAVQCFDSPETPAG